MTLNNPRYAGHRHEVLGSSGEHDIQLIARLADDATSSLLAEDPALSFSAPSTTLQPKRDIFYLSVHRVRSISDFWVASPMRELRHEGGVAKEFSLDIVGASKRDWLYHGKKKIRKHVLGHHCKGHKRSESHLDLTAPFNHTLLGYYLSPHYHLAADFTPFRHTGQLQRRIPQS